MIPYHDYEGAEYEYPPHEEVELKPCPFCGGKADLDTYYSNNVFFDEPTKIYKVFCQDCLCQTDEEYIKDKAIEVWNKRVVAE